MSQVPLFANLSGRAPRFLLLVLVLGGLAHLYLALSPTTEGPFRLAFVHHNAARYAIAGRNYARNGFSPHLAAPDLTPGKRGAEDAPRLYLHHPPLAPWICGFALAHGEEKESTVQRPFLWIGLLVPLALFLLARRVLAGAGPAIAAALAAVIPMSGLYGGHVDPQGPIVLISLALQVGFYVRYRQTRSKGALLGIALSALLGLLSDWTAAYPLGLFPIVERLLAKREGREPRFDRALLGLAVLPVLFFMAYIAWIVAIGLAPGAALFHGAGVRTLTGLLAQGGDMSAQLKAALVSQSQAFVRLFSIPLLALALPVLLIPALRRFAAGDRARDLGVALFVLVSCGVIHIVLFPQGALVHDYWTYLFVLPLPLAAAGLIEAIRLRAAQREGEGFGVLLTLLAVGYIGYGGWKTTHATIAAQEATQLPHAFVGKAFRQLARPDQRVLTNLPMYNSARSDLLEHPEITWYSDRILRGKILSVADLERARQEEGSFDRFVYVIPTGSLEDPLFRWLQDNARQVQDLKLDAARFVTFDLPG